MPFRSLRTEALILPICLAVASTACGESGNDGDGSNMQGSTEASTSNDAQGTPTTPASGGGMEGPTLGPMTPSDTGGSFIPGVDTETAPAAPPPLTEDNACAGVEVTPEEIEVEEVTEIVIETEVVQPVALYIVLDNSPSMNEDLPGQDAQQPGTPAETGDAGAPVVAPAVDPVDAPRTRWELAVTSLSEFVNAPASDGVDVAVQYFNPIQGQGQGQGQDQPDVCDGVWHSTPDVPMGRLPDNAGAIVASLENAETTGLTPTVGALAGGIAFCEQFQLDNPEESCVVVLVTDGLPRSCGLCPGNVSVDCYDEMSPAVLLPIAEAGFAAGVRTFTVGMDGVPDQGFTLLDSIAAAGGTDCSPPDVGAEACNVSSGGSQGLVDALNSIRDTVTVTEIMTETMTVTETKVLECQWNIPAAPEEETLDPERVNVLLSLSDAEPEIIGSVMNAADCAATDGLGWYYDDPVAPTMIFACPESCAAIQSGMNPKVEIQLGCAKVPQRGIAK